MCHLILQEGGDQRIGEGGDEGAEALEGRHPHPSALVLQQVEEQRTELCLSDAGAAHTRDGHEDIGTGFPNSPHPVLAKVEKFGKQHFFRCLGSHHSAKVSEICGANFPYMEQRVCAQSCESTKV